MTMTLADALDMVTAAIDKADAYNLTTALPYVCFDYRQATDVRECLRVAVHEPAVGPIGEPPKPTAPPFSHEGA